MNENIKNKIIPDFFTAITVSFVVLVFDFISHSFFTHPTAYIIFSSIAASTYILFIHRKSKFSIQRKFVISYLLAYIGGIVGITIISYTGIFISLGISIILVIVLMDLVDSDHPPAISLTFAFVLSDMELRELYSILICMGIILALRYILDNYIIKDISKDLKRVI